MFFGRRKSWLCILPTNVSRDMTSAFNDSRHTMKDVLPKREERASETLSQRALEVNRQTETRRYIGRPVDFKSPPHSIETRTVRRVKFQWTVHTTIR